MKKNILFVMSDLCAGGGQKSLVNLLSQIDYSLYNVDLFLLDHSGIFMELVPKEVNILSLPKTFKTFALPLQTSFKKFLVKGDITLAFNRLMFTVKNRTTKWNYSMKEQYSWKYRAKSLESLEKNYDIAIGFLEKTSTYFCVDKVRALKKIGWIHIDYDQLGMDPKFDIHYFSKLDNIVTVSEQCAAILKNRFPHESQKVKVLYNIVSPSMINKLANQSNTDVYCKENNEIIILSIGRLDFQKGFEMAVNACKKLVDSGYNVKWHIIGEGPEREKLTSLIKNNKLEKNFKLLGLKSNPYPYIKQADIYAQTSRFEGKAIAVDEAKILNKPIIVTNFSTAKDQLTNNRDGLIVEMNSDAIAVGVEQLINDSKLRESLVTHLSQLALGTEREINKLYQLI
jgi:glycosyltransferase involved in cell wall biosynthesis